MAPLTTAWTTAGTCVQRTSTVPASGNALQGGINKVAHIKKHGKRAKNARAHKGAPVVSDDDTEVLAQVLGLDNEDLLWEKP